MRTGFQTLGWLAMVVVIACAGTALAQAPSLDSAVMRKNGRWSADEREQVRRYIDYHAGSLSESDLTAVIADARQRLLGPLQTPGATPTGKDQYSAMAATAIEPALDRESELVRLNATIVAGSLFGGHAVDLVADAMDDDSVAVQYWAFKAGAQVLGQRYEDQPVVDEADRRRLLRAAMAVLPQLESPDVRERAYDMLAQLNLPEARRALMQAMESRLSHYMANGLSQGLRAERTGFRRLYRTLLEAQLQGQANEQEVRTLLRVGTKYLRLLGTKAADGIDLSLGPVCLELVDALDPTLKWATGVFDPGFRSANAPNLRDTFAAGPGSGQEPYVEFRLNVEAWVDIVRKAANFTPADMALPSVN